MKLEDITPVLLTCNEEANIDRTLGRLTWAESIIVLDSFSSDRTESICQDHPNIRFERRKFDTHSQQWNAAVHLAKTPWVLSLDADYQVTDQLLSEIRQIEPSLAIKGYAIPFLFAVTGFPLRAHLLPPRIALFEKASAVYIQDGHTQDLQVRGDVETLNNPLIHDDRKPFERWFASQIKYAQLEVEKLSSTPFRQMTRQDQLRALILPAPVAVLFYTLFIKGLILEGPAGWTYSLHRCIAEGVLSTLLIRKLLE
ncbi:MAG: glycosyltransferase family 2 protein [Verrucomicrobiota bacterium]